MRCVCVCSCTCVWPPPAPFHLALLQSRDTRGGGGGRAARVLRCLRLAAPQGTCTSYRLACRVLSPLPSRGKVVFLANIRSGRPKTEGAAGCAQSGPANWTWRAPVRACERARRRGAAGARIRVFVKGDARGCCVSARGREGRAEEIAPEHMTGPGAPSRLSVRTPFGTSRRLGERSFGGGTGDDDPGRAGEAVRERHRWTERRAFHAPLPEESTRPRTCGQPCPPYTRARRHERAPERCLRAHPCCRGFSR